MNERCGAHFPYTDGTLYFDFGGADSGQTRIQVAGLTYAESDVFVLSVGPRGMEIWQNGKLRASNGSNPSRTANTYPWGFGGNNTSASGFSPNAIWYAAGVAKRQFPSAVNERLSADLWGTAFAASPRRIYFDAGAGGGTTSGTIAGTETTDSASISATITTGAAVAATETTDAAAITATLSTTAQVAATESTDAAAISATVTTGAAIGATETTDAASITGNAAVGTTSASISATESTDTTSVTGRVTTGAAVAATDYADTANVQVRVTTGALIAVTETTDSCAITTSGGTSPDIWTDINRGSTSWTNLSPASSTWTNL